MAEKYTPSLAAIRTWYALDRAMYGEDQEFEQGIKEFDRVLREHDAALIESLADEIVHEGVFARVTWLRKKARERREGVS